jgi:hypothetical protein
MSKEMTMKATSYLANLAAKTKTTNDWYQVKPGTAAVAIAETTEFEVMELAGERGDISVMNPSDLLEMFEDYEDPNCEVDEWGVL